MKGRRVMAVVWKERVRGESRVGRTRRKTEDGAVRPEAYFVRGERQGGKEAFGEGRRRGSGTRGSERLRRSGFPASEGRARRGFQEEQVT